MCHLPRLFLATCLAFGALHATDAAAQCAEGTQTYDYWYSANTQHETGSAFGLDWRVRPDIDQPGRMVYGPYVSGFGVGPHRAGFVLQVHDNVTSPKAIIASLKIQSRDGRRILAQRDISRRDFTVVNDWQWFNLYFDNPCGEALETVIEWRGNAKLIFAQVHIWRL